jgi:hypothetical protein
VDFREFKRRHRDRADTIGTGLTGTGATPGIGSTGHERPDEQYGRVFSGDEWVVYEFGNFKSN